MIITRPQLGQESPDFSAPSTSGQLSLSQYRGQWVVLFSYAKDDTSICTSQCLSFADHYETFKALDAQLIGLSVDPLDSHQGWIAKLEKEKRVKLSFPLIADVDKKVSRFYGVLDEEKGMSVRGVFVIDPHGKLRFMAYYPLQIAPNVEEIVRVLIELKQLRA